MWRITRYLMSYFQYPINSYVCDFPIFIDYYCIVYLCTNITLDYSGSITSVTDGSDVLVSSDGEMRAGTSHHLSSVFGFRCFTKYMPLQGLDVIGGLNGRRLIVQRVIR